MPPWPGNWLRTSSGLRHGLLLPETRGRPHAILNTQLFLDYDHAGGEFGYPIIPITVHCYGQHAIARRGGLARFADINDEQLDPVGPSPARCFALGAAVARALGRSDLRVALVASSAGRTKSYRGFVFACFDPHVVDLITYLAGARAYLDLVVDAAGGELEVIPGTNEYGMNANWKLLVENSIEPEECTACPGIWVTDTPLLQYRAPWGRPIAKWEPLFGVQAKGELEAQRAELVAQHGEERAVMMSEINRNMLIYPNLVINDIMAVTVRTFMPTSPASMTVTASPRNEQAEVRQRRLDSFLTFLGPGGFATPDDIEALESCQAGFTSGGIEWNDISPWHGSDGHGNRRGADEGLLATVT